MPNWCDNSITITGPAEKILDVWSKAQEPESGLINALFPMPVELKGTTASSDDVNWYTWRIENWGTKWDVSLEGLELETADGTATISGWFSSAWSPPTGAYETFCDENPGCSIKALYNEGSGCCFAGKWDNEIGDDCYYYNQYLEEGEEECEEECKEDAAIDEVISKCDASEVVSREGLFAWLATCPSDKWKIINDDFGVTSIKFLYEEESDESEV